MRRHASGRSMGDRNAWSGKDAGRPEKTAATTHDRSVPREAPLNPAVLIEITRSPGKNLHHSTTISGHKIWIGRGEDNDLSLPDADHVVSRIHCVLEYDAFWKIRDVSTNGTFLNRSSKPIGYDKTAPLIMVPGSALVLTRSKSAFSICRRAAPITY